MFRAFVFSFKFVISLIIILLYLGNGLVYFSLLFREREINELQNLLTLIIASFYCLLIVFKIWT